MSTTNALVNHSRIWVVTNIVIINTVHITSPDELIMYEKNKLIGYLQPQDQNIFVLKKMNDKYDFENILLHKYVSNISMSINLNFCMSYLLGKSQKINGFNKRLEYKKNIHHASTEYGNNGMRLLWDKKNIHHQFSCASMVNKHPMLCPCLSNNYPAHTTSQKQNKILAVTIIVFMQKNTFFQLFSFIE